MRSKISAVTLFVIPIFSLVRGGLFRLIEREADPVGERDAARSFADRTLAQGAPSCHTMPAMHTGSDTTYRCDAYRYFGALPRFILRRTRAIANGEMKTKNTSTKITMPPALVSERVGVRVSAGVDRDRRVIYGHCHLMARDAFQCAL